MNGEKEQVIFTEKYDIKFVIFFSLLPSIKFFVWLARYFLTDTERDPSTSCNRELMEMLNWDLSLIQQLEVLHGTVSSEEASNANNSLDYGPIIVQMLAGSNTLEDEDVVSEVINSLQ